MHWFRVEHPKGDGVARAIGIACFAAFLSAFFVLLHWHYPDTGHDFGTIFIKLLEGTWHFHHRGLAVPRYAVHICGGGVFYGHPEDLFYSPLQMLALVLDPWLSIQLVVGAVLVVGYIGWYRVGCFVLNLPKAWAHLLALVALANGFYFLQILAGHVGSHALPLLGWFVLLCFERDRLSGWALAKHAVAFALLCAYALYSSSWLTLYLFVLSLLLLLPVDICLAAQPGRRAVELLRRAAAYGVAVGAVTASKLVAIYSFMRHFSRHVPLQSMDPACSTLAFLVRALWGIPQNNRLLQAAPAFIHEKSALMSPITAVGLAAGLVLLARRLLSPMTGWRARGFVALYGSVAFVAMVHLVRGRGWFAETLHAVPIGASMRVSTRYLYIFALLLSAAAVWSLARAFERRRRRWNLIVVALSGFITVAAFLGAYAKMLPEVGLASNMRAHRAHWQAVDFGAPVSRVSFSTDFNGATGRTCYDPILNSAGTPSLVLHEGSPLDIENGYYNLMNPACYQYPDENDCKPGKRISATDGDNLRRLTNGQPVTWRISTAQYLADGVTVLSLLAFFAFFIVRR